MAALFLRRGYSPTKYMWKKYTLADGGKGTLVGNVFSDFSIDYPANGAQDGFWYVKVK